MKLAHLFAGRTSDFPARIPGLGIKRNGQYSVLMFHRNLAGVARHHVLFPVQAGRVGIDLHHADQRLPNVPPHLGRIHFHLAHRSISPRTISMEPITATTSARSRPAHMVSRACREAKVGLRMCTRYGLAVPSLTTKYPISPRGDSMP